MRAFAKSILISILVAAAIVVFTNFIYFFPWYTTLIVETFNVTQIVASDNYLKEEHKENVLDNLKERPIFRERAEDIEISVKKEPDDENDHSAEGENDPTIYEDDAEDYKPYRQRGEPVTVTLKAVYPFTITIFGQTIERELPVSFTLKTVGLKHYKDLPYYEYLEDGIEGASEP